MAEKYDGWTIKNKNGDLSTWRFRWTRKEVIDAFEKGAGANSWKKACRKQGLTIVKVKLVEVEE